MARFRYDVTRCAPAEEHAVITSLARAFHDDPLFNFFLPDHVKQARGLLRFMQANVTDAQPFGEVWVARRAGSDAVAGAAVWLPPDAYPRGTRRDLAQLARMIPGSATGIGPRVPAVLRLLRRIDEVHPHERHWYLAVLGVDPLFQRTGAGGALLQPVLARCDTEALPAYLETQKPENVPYYRTFGFDVVQELDVRGCPPLWTMSRAPQAVTA